MRELLRMDVPCDASAPGVVRRAIGEVREISCVRDDAMLVASELVSNAVAQSGCTSAERIEACVAIGGDSLRIAVHDQGTSGQRPRLRPPDHAGHGGVGLRIVEELARAWGVEQPEGRLIWAQLAIGRSCVARDIA